jgi:hypothetical protein
MTQKLTKMDENGDCKLVPRKSPPRKDKIFRRLEATVPREELLSALAAASSDQRARTLFEMMLDPAFRTHSLPKLAKDVGLRYTDVLKLVRDYKLDQGLLAMASHLPQVMEDVAIDAKSKMVKCPACKGDGRIVVTEQIEDPESEKKRVIVVPKLDENGAVVTEHCFTCDGEGKLRQTGDSDARKLLFESMKLTGQRAPLVAQQFNLGAAGTMEDDVERVQDALTVKPAAPADVIDVVAEAPVDGTDRTTS